MLLLLTKPFALAAAATFWVGVPTIFFVSSGNWSAYSNLPSNFSSSGASCSQCHAGSAPSAQSSRMSVTAGSHALSAGQSTQVTAALDSSGTNTVFGGFLCEATAGAFNAGGNTQTANGVSTISISHVDRNSRDWTFDFVAPATPGLVELTAAGLASSGSSSSGDYMSFSGFDKTATSATPARLYVLPSGVTNIGSSCSDGYGNVSVLGASDSPTVGNAGFELRLHGAAPGAMAFAWGAAGPGGFSASLDPIGLTGCNAYVNGVTGMQTAMTSTGLAMRADGSAAFALPIPSNPALLGSKYHVQTGYIDPSVGSAIPAGSTVPGLPRSLDVSLSNGLEITIQ